MKKLTLLRSDFLSRFAEDAEDGEVWWGSDFSRLDRFSVGDGSSSVTALLSPLRFLEESEK